MGAVVSLLASAGLAHGELKKESIREKMQRAEKLIKGGAIQYEFVFGSDKARREVAIELRGMIVNAKKAGAEEKEKDK